MGYRPKTSLVDNTGLKFPYGNQAFCIYNKTLHPVQNIYHKKTKKKNKNKTRATKIDPILEMPPSQKPVLIRHTGSS